MKRLVNDWTQLWRQVDKSNKISTGDAQSNENITC
jgi:hypothetical protein